MKIYDIIIIGGGISGLSAAIEIAKNGFKILLLEARNRLGGRVLSENFYAIPIELGAEFIHSQKSCFYNYIHQLNLQTYNPHSSNNNTLYHTKKGGLQNSNFATSELLEKAFQFFSNFSEDISIAEAFDKIPKGILSKQEELKAKNWIEAYHALDITKASLKFILAEDNESTTIKLKAPYLSVVKNLEKKINNFNVDIKLNYIVSQIDWTDSTIKVVDDKTSFFAKKVLLTVPISILKNKSIEFNPPLPKEKALSYFEMGIAERVNIILKKNPFDREFTFLYSHDTLFNYWLHTTVDLEYFLLTAWVGGTRANQIQNFNEQKVKETAIDCLSQICPYSQKELKKNLYQIFYHSWSQDPFSQGAYSYITPGGIKGPELLAEPIGQKLYFAGEATAQNYQTSTVHGGFESGKRVAKEILSSLE